LPIPRSASKLQVFQFNVSLSLRQSNAGSGSV
jgi:hypothetical protein